MHSKGDALALPDIFSPTEPQASEAVATGPAKLQANFQALADFLGIPVAPTQLTGAAFSITSGGIVTFAQGGATLIADPITALGIATKQYVDGKALGLPTGTATGTNTYAVALSPVPASLAVLTGVPVTVTFGIGNTDISTLNPNALGAVSIVQNGAALAPGSILANQTYVLVYNGTNFALIGAFQPPMRRAYKPTDQSVTSSTALVNDNNLLFSVLASEVWQFEVDVYGTFDGSVASGLKVAFTVPAGCTLQWALTGSPAITASGTSAVLALGGTNSSIMTKLIGQAIVGSTAGTVQLQFAQNTSAATATTLKTGSSLIATRLNP